MAVMADEHDCGHVCCDERLDPMHDHFLSSRDCPSCKTRWQHALDDLWGCIGKREMEHLQPETVRLAKENHETLWHNHDGPVCMADGLPWWHPHHFATVKSPNE